MEQEVKLKLKLEIQNVWANVANPDLSMEQAVEILKLNGNTILEVDEENRRILLHVKE
jgi:hypothetical protein